MRWITFFFFTSLASLHASYVGNPAFPKIPEQGLHISKESYLSIEAGYIGSYTFDRNLKLTGSHLKNAVDESQMLTNLGELSFSFLEKMDLYGRLGTFYSHISHVPLSGLKVDYRTRQDFMWCLGINELLFEKKNCLISFNANYTQSAPHIKVITVNGTAITPHHSKMCYQEWQAALGVSQSIDLFVPYLGIKYSQARVHFKKLSGLQPYLLKSEYTMRSQDCVGIFLGCSLTPNKTILLNFEVRVIDETSISFSGQVRF